MEFQKQLLSRYHISLTVASVLLGLLLSISFYTKSRVEISTPRSSELLDVVDKMQKDRNELKSILTSLRGNVSKYERRSAAAKGNLVAFTKEEQKLKESSGLYSASGQGIKIIIADASSVPEDANPNDYIVHNTDLQSIVNAIWNGDAKAVSVNGQRLVGTSAIRCVGNTILVNSNLVGSPYEIRAIGDIKKINNSLSKDESVNMIINQYVKTYGINYEVREGKVDVPPFRGSLGVKYSRLVTGSESRSGVK